MTVDEEQSASLPLEIVLGGAMLLVMIFFWCCAASGYAHDVEGQRLGRVAGPRQMGAAALIFFLTNGAVQISNLPAVVRFTFERQWWVLIGWIVVEGLVVAGYFGIKVVERKLEGPKRKKKVK